MSAPLNAKALRRAVDEAARRRSVVPGRLQYTVASTIALQMVPDGAAKGGGAIRQRVSEAEARLTTDLDFARPTAAELDVFLDAYSDQLESGWSGFTGMLKAEKSKRPDNVPVDYIMDRFSIKLKYLGQPYCSVMLELVHAEIGSADAAVERLGTDIAAIFDEIGLLHPAPVKVVSAEHQIVQKLHACTGDAARARAHDLVDIQILAAIEDIDQAEIGRIGPRLFAYRRRQAWPPFVVPHDGWPDLYAAALTDLHNEAVLPSLDAAVDLVNRLIEQAAASAES
jgi:Nucleotidyl transferase AbiEii toxin, Type IV TA system